MRHHCTPETCPYVVYTREGYVCTLTGECKGQALMVSCDPNDGMQVLHQKGHRGELAEVVPADRNCGKMLVVQHRSRYNKNYAAQYEHVYRECRSVAYRLMHNWKENPGLKNKHKNALREGLRQMNGRLRAHKRENGRGVLSTALLTGYLAYVSSGGKYAVQTPPEDEFIEHCARRGAQICLQFFLTSQPKQFPMRSTKYYAVVIMYLLKVGRRFPSGARRVSISSRFSFEPRPARTPRPWLEDGVLTRDVCLVEPETRLRGTLPDLADLALFGLEKSKFTEALKKLQKYFQQRLAG